MTSHALFLGMDVGGTAARWALADAHGVVHAQGESPGWSAAAWGTASQAALEQAVRRCAQTLHAQSKQGTQGTQGLRAAALLAGVTGFDGPAPGLTAFVTQAFDLAPADVELMSDVALACSAHFAPGEGIVLIAGTGSIAAHVDAQGQLQRAGGRGVLLDDAGGGYWIAREALRAVWRREDEAPGAWRDSVLAQYVFAVLGGSDWAHTRSFMASASRGEVGALAVAVAQAARAGDAPALAVLQQAGAELARLVAAMVQRVGAQPVVVCGRAARLHPCIELCLRQALPPDVTLRMSDIDLAEAAARLAQQAAAVRCLR
jgi:glucosamine kinase